MVILASACKSRIECAIEVTAWRGFSQAICDCSSEGGVVECCIGLEGRGGIDLTGTQVPARTISGETAVCIAASTGMNPGLSDYFAVYDPYDQGDDLWAVEMITGEECHPDGTAEGVADYWSIDGVYGDVIAEGTEHYSAVVCAYGG